ncbi:MAG: tetratricopeptide repeat protein [Paludisphaera borealis]|uniref:tetratricopeptide repeat protein n=1 Tax=Paludisphaera borealis TaxID=1387353 RepID=UPI00283DBDED|nr:tetratricopeptide repeat protein [Paludisphaera borealis]MDR3622735.1 tetratricopeptide repeat protein [Paludisphaera borealis]
MKRTLRILGIAVPLALALTAVVVLPGWVPLFPRAMQRGMTEGLLRGTLFFYVAVCLAAFVGAPYFGWRTIQNWRRKRRGSRSERVFLLCLSCLFSFVALELGAAAVQAWTHRFPILTATFPARPADAYRIVVLGESSALGEPYRPWISIGQIVAWKLGEAMPDRRFETEILAWLGDSLEKQHQKLGRITQRPDAVIVYSGHNEFAARFEENRDYSLDLEPRAAVVRQLHQASLLSPFCRLVYELISKNRLDSPPSLKDHHQLIDPPLCSPTEAAAILTDFTARLEAIVAYCERIGALPILVISPANEADYEPSRSTLAPGVDQAERNRLVVDFQEARDAEPAKAEAFLRAILDRHPGFAEAHYRLGKILERSERIDEAREHFRLALDDDGLPIRCPEPFREAYRQVAERHPGCILIDGRREVAAASPSDLLDDHVIEDTHHPNLKGYVALAAAVLRELADRAVFGSASTAIQPPTLAASVAHFGIDPKRLAEACDRTSLHYKRVSGYRYDPAERLEASRRFAEAARRLRAGATIHEVGLPAFDFQETNQGASSK